MEKQLAYRNQRQINEDVEKIKTSAKWHFQNFVDRYNSISILPTLESDDLVEFMDNPKSFLVLKLTNGETLNVGELKLSSEKVYDLLDRPAEVDQLVNDIQTLNSDYSYQSNHRQNLVFFDIIENKLVVKESIVNEITEKYSSYIETENQFRALEIANDIVLKINELFKIGDCSKLRYFDNYGNGYKAPLERLFAGSGDSTSRTYDIDLKSIVDAF